MRKPSFDTLCEQGRIAREKGDDSRWELGDLASEVETCYGKDAIGEFAKEVLAAKKTIQEYRSMAGFFEKPARAEFLATHPNIAYSHMRLAKRLGDPLLAYQFLEEVAENTWTVDQAARELALQDLTPQSVKVAASVPVTMPYGTGQTVSFVFPQPAYQALWDALENLSGISGQLELTLVWRPYGEVAQTEVTAEGDLSRFLAATAQMDQPLPILETAAR